MGASLPPLSRVSAYRAIGSGAFSPDVSRRAPNQYDDTGVGYDSAKSQIWVTPDKKVYQIKRHTANDAAWVRMNDAPFPGDVAKANLVACYGTRRLVRGYTGNAIKVKRASDSTELDIGFLSDGALDAQSLDAFLYGTTGNVTVWYDQSGNAYDATPTAGYEPVIPQIDQLGANRGVLFDHSVTVNGNATAADGTVGKIKQALNIPSGVSVTANAHSVVSLAAFGHGTRSSPLTTLSGATDFTLGNNNARGVNALVVAYGSTSINKAITGFRPPLTPNVYGYSSGSGLSVYARDTRSASAGSQGSATLTGGYIGLSNQFRDGASNTDVGYNIQGAVLIFNKAISYTEYLAMMAGLYALYGLAPQVRANIICDGDSITEGAYGTWFQNWPRQMAGLLGFDANVYGVGIGGGTFSSQTAAVQKWSSLYDANAPANVLVIACGTNDINAGSSLSTLQTALQAYIAEVRARSWNGDIWACTILPRGSLTEANGKEQIRTGYNAWLKANVASLGLAGVIDFAGDATMGASAAYNDGTFWADTTHPNMTGLGMLAMCAARTIGPLVFGKLCQAAA